MEKLFLERLKDISKEKAYGKQRLMSLNNDNQNLGAVTETHQLILKEQDFQTYDQIQIQNQECGVMMNSSLPIDRHQYADYNNDSGSSNLFKYFYENQKKQVELICRGFISGNCSVEVHVIFSKQDGVKLGTIKVNIDETAHFIVPKLESNDQVKITIRLKRPGKVYLHNFLFVAREKEREIQLLKRKNSIKKIKDLNVIFIADEFTTRAFEPEFNLIKITPDNWENEVLDTIPDLFFCESAWLGNNGLWQNKVGTGGPRNNQILLRVLDWCKSRGIPSVFWNKEDPFHFNAFVDTAKCFDFVFTTDFNSIEKYKMAGCKEVFVFPFGAQPKYHNPIESFERKEKVVFAGAYYGEKFPERKRVMDNMINISGQYGIEIFDRNYENPNSPNQFPEDFQKYIMGNLKGDEIDIAYKGYKVSLNVNSIVDSPTMFSRRVFELLASNTPVVSSESFGVKNLLGDLVINSSDYEELREGIQLLFEDDKFYKEIRLKGLREVLSNHTYENRIANMLDCIGFEYQSTVRTVTVIGVVKSQEDYKKLMKQFNRQVLEKKKLIILLDIFEGYLDIFNQNNNGLIHTYLIDYMHHYKSISEIIDTEYYAPFNLQNYYDKHYLTDMMLATLYTEKTNIVKNQGIEYSYVTGGRIDQSLIYKECTKLIKPLEFIESLIAQSNELMKDSFRYGVRFFNIDNGNLVLNRQGKNKKEKSKNI
ncbi:glycosyltransferase [Bacillus cereus group sp. BfR-BA-01446]|uniref:CgeB family protein n=1 Tax=Bacillus cereus group sp. BfR-BA-01446 TaxID=2920350 RepID=UPI001F56D94E|nr:glycosyltransferase [Bacillus cereus group sp. BfR-BA-01446]